MSFDGSTIVKINNPKLKALLEEAEKKGLCIKPFMENKLMEQHDSNDFPISFNQ